LDPCISAHGCGFLWKLHFLLWAQEVFLEGLSTDKKGVGEHMEAQETQGCCRILSHDCSFVFPGAGRWSGGGTRPSPL
jgi:hypothetical protein